MRTVRSLLGFVFPVAAGVHRVHSLVIPRLSFKARHLVWSYAADGAVLEELRVGQCQQLGREAAIPIASFAGIDGHNATERARADELLLEVAESARDAAPLVDTTLRLPRTLRDDAALSVDPCHPGYVFELVIRWPAGSQPRTVACVAIGWGLK